ncbi:MAG: tyrosine protein kinase [Saprospiraceae bacterium]|nr:MAG: tyrosine protein kinase [Saprospiraceae bacterium]
MKEDQLDIKVLFNKAFSYWYLFIIFLGLMLAGAYYYLRVTPSTYEAEALLLIRDEKESSAPLEELIFKELGLNGEKKNLLDETMILRSTPLMEQVVENLELQYQYINQGRIKHTEMYEHSSVKVLNWEPKPGYGGLSVILHPEEDGKFSLEINKKDHEDLDLPVTEFSGEFGKELDLPLGKLTLTRSDWGVVNYPIAVVISTIKERAKGLSDALEVELIGEKSSTLKLKIKDNVAKRAEDLLMELMKMYDQRTLEKKNKIFENSISLINERINLITEELSSAEKDVESYKRQFNMMELSSEGNLLMKELSDYNKEISSTEVQLEILGSVEDFLFRNREQFEFVPTNLSLSNLTLTNQLTSFNQLLSQREKLRSDLGPSHPDLLLTEKQIQNLRNTIIDNIRSMKRDLQVKTGANKSLRANLEGRMHSLPRRERELIEIERRKDIKENLYLYLLQKREESVISMAVTVNNSTIVEPAQAWKPISPKRMQIWFIAMFLGFAFPAAIILFLEFLNDKVQSAEEIEMLTSVPVVGIIASGDKSKQLVSQENTQTVEAEMFRLLRANLAYITPEKDLKTILITSSVASEGKSYIALNLAVTQALTGKKVLIMELDLRKPKQAEYTKSEQPAKGIANYLIQPSMRADQIIRNSGVHPNLDIINCGPKPPNPSELILSPRLRVLMDELREQYDFIIMDAPPVGLVADALQMKDMAEATMFIVRSGFTRKKQLRIVKEISEKKKLPKPFIVLNDLNLKKSYANSYAYSGNSSYYEKVKS